VAEKNGRIEQVQYFVWKFEYKDKQARPKKNCTFARSTYIYHQPQQ
jgi:hypothetical protein